jgi:hypothetical protein
VDPQTVSGLGISDPSIARAGMPARAVVSAGGVDTIYLRAGSGEPLVLVAADIDADDARMMFDQLAKHLLVFAAAPLTRNASEFSSWLCSFLEGLGVRGAHVLVHASLVNVLITEGADA